VTDVIEPVCGRPDPLRRFIRTELAVDLHVMGRRVRFETNHSGTLEQTLAAFARYPSASADKPEFQWRLVVGGNSNASPAWHQISGFAAPGLRYISFGQRSYFAIDLEQREAVSFLDEELVSDDLGFVSVFLATLLSMTAARLGLTMLSAACVGAKGRGILVFGPPRSGKTTSVYLAGKFNLELHSDQNTLVELDGHRLGVWGQPWPFAFRPESEKFLPEIRHLTRPFICGDLPFLCLQPHSRQAVGSPIVAPVCCVFLEREAAPSPTLIRLSPSDLAGRLKRSLPFKDDDMFKHQQAEVFCALGELPAYCLLYASDPATAAKIYPQLLATHSLREAIA
jgi:hypothetical protein